MNTNPPISPLSRLRHQILKPDRGDIIAVVVFSVATGVLLLATPIAVQALVNFVALGGSPSQLIVVALLVFLGLGLAGVLTAIQTWVVELLQRRVFVRTVSDIAARLPRVKLEAFQHKHGPELVNRFFDVLTIQKVLSSLLLDGIGLVLSILVGLAVLAFYHPVLLALDILLVVAILLIVLGPIRAGIRTAIAESSTKYAIASWLEEIAANPVLFKTHGATRWVFDRSNELATDYVEARRSHFRIVLGQVMGALVLQIVASTALLSLGGYLVMQGSLTLGQLVAAELIVTLVVAAVAKMGKHVEGIYDLLAAVNKVGVLLDLPLEESGETILESDCSGGASITLNELSYSRGETPLLESLSLEIPAGTTLGITGPSGSGKSTLIELLLRLRKPTAGSIQLEGRDLRVLDLESVRQKMAVAEDGDLVEGTVGENVRLHRDHVRENDVRQALKEVGLDVVVRGLPQEIVTPLHRDGMPLSSGQKKALLLARAIAARPSVLFVDGLLDGLSDEGQQRLASVLFQKDAPWTLVLVSNEPGLLAKCERVIHLDKDGTWRKSA